MADERCRYAHRLHRPHRDITRRKAFNSSRRIFPPDFPLGSYFRK
ncbi:hypothetical protein GWL_32220 [Herbaspirillum sp. GW103]|nr:hypothetical protein GWL_32220 [Herbaspirillum sp. GW103]